MCVAAIINRMPSKNNLEAMFFQNPDGAGFAYQVNKGKYNHNIAFVRGLMTFDDLLLKLNNTELTYPFLLHFRYRTWGELSEEWTQPFPLGERAFKGERVGETDSVLIHNGMWRQGISAAWELCDKKLINSYTAESCSDTAVAAFMARDKEDILDDVEWATALARTSVNGINITLRGKWHYHTDGNLYSNLIWTLPPKGMPCSLPDLFDAWDNTPEDDLLERVSGMLAA
jgi:hypothetical protein